jgi:hypothetical protein
MLEIVEPGAGLGAEYEIGLNLCIGVNFDSQIATICLHRTDYLSHSYADWQLLAFIVIGILQCHDPFDVYAVEFGVTVTQLK